MSNIYSVKDKVILITGATGYLGSKMVEHLTVAGAKVISISRDFDKLKKLSNKLSIPLEQFFEVDVSDEVSVKNAFEQIFKAFDRIDVLVNNAYFGISKKFNDYSRQDWYMSLDGTIVSVDITTQAVVPYMKNNRKGRIINISSMYGMVSPNPEIYSTEEMINPLSYGVGKAGVIQYTKYVAMMLAKYNINVNTISYGPFPNPEYVKDKEFLTKLAKKTFLNRVGKSEEVTAAVFFLSLDENSFLTGQNIIVDGGWTSW